MYSVEATEPTAMQRKKEEREREREREREKGDPVTVDMRPVPQQVMHLSLVVRSVTRRISPTDFIVASQSIPVEPSK